MRFNHKNYPILKKLSEGILGVLPIDPKDEGFFTNYQHSGLFKEYWKLAAPSFNSDINVVSEAFVNAAEKMKVKFATFLQDICVNDRQDLTLCGTYVDKGLVHMLFYEIKKGTEDIDIKYFLFHKSGQPILAHVHVTNIANFTWVSKECGVFSSTEKDKFLNKMREGLFTCMLYAMFKKYADVEVRICEPNTTTPYIKCDYGKIINETNQKINFITSQWFTSIVKDEAFIVRAHFRWQVCGKGFSERKLTLIDSFQKHGYYRQAGKLKQDAA